ncbi:MAG: phospho-sugar mutase [Bacteroidales bacterium]|nr:phospho-sugar mutase [Bacteroidales bacterium]
MKEDILKKVTSWLSDDYDMETRVKVQHLIDNAPKELEECFGRDLEFGTGGLRGIMGVGTNRMNEYTVAMATQGLANYLNICFKNEKIGAAIAYDSRHNSATFAEVATNVLSANGIEVYLFDDLRPTPELSFAVRHLKCKTGIVITASHNPSEYNGYKVYWDDGAQITPPHDENIIAEVQKINNIASVKRTPNPELIHRIGAEMDKEYLRALKTLSLSPQAIENHRDMKIVYTALHGTGTRLVPLALAEFGFNNIVKVAEQAQPDGAFPTVVSPNPEEKEALTIALATAKAHAAELVMATDPDADRVGVAIKNDKGEFILLNGNQTAAILFYYILDRWNALGKLTGKEFTVKTIVTTALLEAISQSYNTPCFDVLTGFKYIAEIIRQHEGTLTYIVGGEESYGYLSGDFVRDKDAVSACCLIAEVAAFAKEQGKSLYDILMDIYLKYGFYKEHLLSITRKGIAGSQEIAEMMRHYRENTPTTINGSKVITFKDYKTGISKNITTGEETAITLPKSDVLQLLLDDGSIITVRPSGTEPKIKFYFGVTGKLTSKAQFDEVNTLLEGKINGIIDGMGV